MKKYNPWKSQPTKNAFDNSNQRPKATKESNLDNKSKQQKNYLLTNQNKNDNQFSLYRLFSSDSIDIEANGSESNDYEISSLHFKH